MFAPLSRDVVISESDESEEELLKRRALEKKRPARSSAPHQPPIKKVQLPPPPGKMAPPSFYETDSFKERKKFREMQQEQLERDQRLALKIGKAGVIAEKERQAELARRAKHGKMYAEPLWRSEKDPSPGLITGFGRDLDPKVIISASKKTHGPDDVLVIVFNRSETNCGNSPFTPMRYAKNPLVRVHSTCGQDQELRYWKDMESLGADMGTMEEHWVPKTLLYKPRSWLYIPEEMGRVVWRYDELLLGD